MSMRKVIKECIDSVENETPQENMTGWVCPKCGNVYSPLVMMCPYCSKSHARLGVTKDNQQMVCS